jgi:hypothetical protein
MTNGDTKTPTFEARSFQRTITVMMNAAQARALNDFIRANNPSGKLPNGELIPRSVWCFAEKLDFCARRVRSFLENGSQFVSDDDQPVYEDEIEREYVSRVD